MTNAFVLQTNILERGERMCFALVTNVLVLETNALKARVQTSAPHRYTCSYQQFSIRTSLEIATHRHSPSKMGCSHTLALTCEYATPVMLWMVPSISVPGSPRTMYRSHGRSPQTIHVSADGPPRTVCGAASFPSLP